MSFNLHRVLYLYQTPSKFYIQPVEEQNEALIIDRHTCDISSTNSFSIGILPANTTSCLIYGIIGIKREMSYSYLIVITKATQVGLIDEQPIYIMDQAQVIPFSLNMPPPKDGQIDWNSTYISMLENMLRTPSFYFSYSYDLTNSYQRTNTNLESKVKTSNLVAHYGYDKRFLWNHHVTSCFDNYGVIADRYRLPLILGFVRINNVNLGAGLSWTLISRRSIDRAGTRFNCRGIDYDGKVANFVETEQIFEYQGSRGSFVQIRGSIPLLWTQKSNYKYMPAIVIGPEAENTQLMVKHFHELVTKYNRVSVVNLIDRKGREANLEHVFSQQMERLRDYQYNIPYHYFDFHKECSKMRWYRLSILMDRIKSDIDSYGYFAVCGNQVIQQQDGVIRSNCIDSLDRTNVVQSMIAQRVLESQLERFRITVSGTHLEDYPEFLDIFKNTWADNADALSVQYAGTPALKTDFTRTGRRTNLGLLKDGVNSMTRYVANNFFDQYRQDSINLFLGKSIGLYKPWDLTSYTSTIPVTIVILTLVALYIYLRF